MPAHRFKRGEPRPAGAGRRAGTPNRVAASIKEICQKAAPELIAELFRLAKHGRHEMTRIAAAMEVLDRGDGKATRMVEGEMIDRISAELQRLLDRHDGESRSIPMRNGALIEHDVGDNNGGEALPAPNG